MKAYLLLAAAIACEVVATTALKASDGFTRAVPSAVTAVGYAISFWCLALALRDIPTGIAYAIWSGIGIVAISLIAWLLHGQRLDAAAIAGMALILCGVLVINLFSKPGGH